jgi:hypothetical protein
VYNKFIQRDEGEQTVEGLGSRILLISFFALEENHGGHVKSALNICSRTKTTFSLGKIQ